MGVSEVVSWQQISPLVGDQRVPPLLGASHCGPALALNWQAGWMRSLILALWAGQVHVPYRDSMMTSVLRDSLGGNCQGP